MGVNIYLRGIGEISPGWNKQMAKWLGEIGKDSYVDHGPHDHGESPPTIRFTAEHIPALEERRDKQLIGELAPPYDTSPNWTRCFDIIIDTIRASGEAIVEHHW